MTGFFFSILFKKINEFFVLGDKHGLDRSDLVTILNFIHITNGK